MEDSLIYADDAPQLLCASTDMSRVHVCAWCVHVCVCACGNESQSLSIKYLDNFRGVFPSKAQEEKQISEYIEIEVGNQFLHIVVPSPK